MALPAKLFFHYVVVFVIVAVVVLLVTADNIILSCVSSKPSTGSAQDTLTNSRGTRPTTTRFQSTLNCLLSFFNLWQDPLVLEPVLMSYHEMEEYLHLVV